MACLVWPNCYPAEATGVAPAPDFAAEEDDGALVEQAGKMLRQSIPAVVRALLEGAEKGGVTHIKLALELLGVDKGSFAGKKVHPEEKTMEEIFLEKWNREP